MLVAKNKSVPFCWKLNTLSMQILRNNYCFAHQYDHFVWWLKSSNMWPRHTLFTTQYNSDLVCYFYNNAMAEKSQFWSTTKLKSYYYLLELATVVFLNLTL